MCTQCSWKIEPFFATNYPLGPKLLVMLSLCTALNIIQCHQSSVTGFIILWIRLKCSHCRTLFQVWPICVPHWNVFLACTVTAQCQTRHGSSGSKFCVSNHHFSCRPTFSWNCMSSQKWAPRASRSIRKVTKYFGGRVPSSSGSVSAVRKMKRMAKRSTIWEKRPLQLSAGWFRFPNDT